MRGSGSGDDVLDVITVHEPGPEKDTSHVYVDGDVAASQVPERDVKLAFEELDGHRGFLLADPSEAFEAAAEFLGGGPITPDQAGIGLVVGDDACGGVDDPISRDPPPSGAVPAAPRTQRAPRRVR